MQRQPRPFEEVIFPPQSKACWTGVYLVLLCALPTAAARAAELQDASNLLKRGQQTQALETVNKTLATNPRDPQGRFLKGLILIEQNKQTEAIELLSRLTKDFPDLPEPHNNLAVIYASQGQYEKARQSLETSIRTHPSYATAYKNLQVVYANLARQAYDQALQMERTPSAPQALTLVREIAPQSAQVAVITAIKPDAPKAGFPRELVASSPRSSDNEVRAESRETPKAQAQSTSRPAASVARQATPDAPLADKADDEVVKVVRSWAQAWAGKNVKAYLSFYARDFKTPAGESRAEWAKGRAARIQAPKSITVAVESPRVTFNGDTLANVTFRQAYRSDRTTLNSTKTLVLTKSSGKWLIQQERAGN